jgi:inhibitor of KinA
LKWPCWPDLQVIQMIDLHNFKIYPLGERSAVIDLGNVIDERLNAQVLAMGRWLWDHRFRGLKDVIIAYSSLTLLYDPYIIYNGYNPAEGVFGFVETKLREAYAFAGEEQLPEGKLVHVPVCYEPEFGPDLGLLAGARNLKVAELVQLHCATDYRVYMLGFLPGFAYMGRVHPQLVMPRRSRPRQKVMAGSVGIAGWQTGVYPLDSPGGWQVIGRTPMKMFDPQADPPVPVAAGDRVRFYPITREAFDQWPSQNHQHAHHS